MWFREIQANSTIDFIIENVSVLFNFKGLLQYIPTPFHPLFQEVA